MPPDLRATNFPPHHIETDYLLRNVKKKVRTLVHFTGTNNKKGGKVTEFFVQLNSAVRMSLVCFWFKQNFFVKINLKFVLKINIGLEKLAQDITLFLVIVVITTLVHPKTKKYKIIIYSIVSNYAVNILFLRDSRDKICS